MPNSILIFLYSQFYMQNMTYIFRFKSYSIYGKYNAFGRKINFSFCVTILQRYSPTYIDGKVKGFS